MQDVYKGKYKRIERIGNGAFGVIYKIKTIPDGQLLIAKHIALQNVEKAKALQQFQILAKLRHHYIVRYVESFTTEDELVLIMEYCGERDLYWHIEQRRQAGKHFSERLVTNWIFQMLLAVGFMHANRIVHRDLKPQNIFVDSDMNLKVGDFGISKLLDSTAQNCKTSAGTPSYMAPEMMESQNYSYKADIWSLGCVIYEVCALDRMFPTKDAQDKPIGIFRMMDLIRQGQIKDIPSLYSQDLRKLVRKMLIRNPDKRPKIQDLLKDSVLVQVMINVINQKDSLRHQYPKGMDTPSLSESIIDRQTNVVKEQLQKLQAEVNQKMAGMKNKKVAKGQLDNYQKEIKQKMKEVQKVVKLAFAQLNKKGKFDQSQQSKKKESLNIKNSSKMTKNLEKSTISNQSDLTIKSIESSNIESSSKIRTKLKNSSLSNQSDLTIQSMDFSSKQNINNESDIELVQSLAVQSMKKNKSKNDSKLSSSLRSQIQKSKAINSQNDPFEGTLQSEYTQTVKQPPQNSQTLKDPQGFATSTLNKLDLLQKTLQKNPQALLNDSFLNCTLSLSSDPIRFSKQIQGLSDKSISFDLTKRQQKNESPLSMSKQKLQKSTRQSVVQKKQQEDQIEYKEDFEEYEQNEQQQARRAEQLKTMLSLYQQTLVDLGQGQQFMSTGSKLRNKYLVMSEIKEQSNEGGSMISRNDSLQ